MDKKTLISLACVIVVLIVLLFATDSLLGGLPGATRELFDVEKSEISKTSIRIGEDQQRVDQMVSRDKAFLEPISQREGWQDELTAAASEIEAVGKRLNSKAKPLFEKNESDDAAALTTLLQEIRAARVSALARAESARKRAEKLVYFKEKRRELVDGALAAYQALDNGELSQLEVKAAQSAADWPEKSSDIEQRMGVFATLKDKAEASHTFVVNEDRKETTEIDFEALGRHAEVLTEANTAFRHSISSISTLLDQLYVSWDKVLEDMEIREGYEVEFYHTYKRIEVDRNNQSKSSDQTQKVSKSFFQQHEKNLGMTLESKPKGKYDFEADKQTAPPGYGYVGNSHYGQWKRDSHGNSFWEFYGKYALMRDLFWGPSFYRPIYRSDWDGYRQSRSTGRTYYGRDTSGNQVYGSKGKMSRTKYANSRYTSSKGFSNTQYKKSGGKYRGSRYAPKSSSRSSSASSRSSSSRTSYSSRSRSSSSRSGSRSFGGK